MLTRLRQFIQRQRALSLYRSIIRGTRRISDPDTRFESARYARDEFERHRRVTDLVGPPVQEYPHGWQALV